MIRNVIVHLFNDQPVVADMFEMPSAGDSGLVCTNLRTLDGRRPVFIERSSSTFFFPYQHIRFVEIVDDRSTDPDTVTAPAESTSPTSEPVDEDLEIDEDFLRRIREA